METFDTSPSTSLKRVPHEPTLKCQICDEPAHGYHHGALTCRACCTFFRRSAGASLLWKCKNQEKCGMNKSGKLCKKCRLAKCYRSGMHMEKFRLKNDTDDKSQEIQQSFKKVSEMPVSLEKFVGRPHMIIRCEPKSPNCQKTFMDFTELVEKGFEILSKKIWKIEGTSSIQSLAIHTKKMRKVNLHGSVIYGKVGIKENMRFWEIDFCRAAEWLSHFEEFQTLPIYLKMKFLKSIWNLRALLEMVILRADRLSRNAIPVELVPLDDNSAVDITKFEVDLSWCSHYENDKLGYFLESYRKSKFLDAAGKVLLDLKPTDIEQIFLILQTCFSYAGKLHRGEIQEISEKLLETVSNQMHDYYSNVLKMRNYSSRIVRLLKCEQYMLNCINLQKERIEIGQIFDIFNVRYSHPEMFTNFGYS